MPNVYTFDKDQHYITLMKIFKYMEHRQSLNNWAHELFKKEMIEDLRGIVDIKGNGIHQKERMEHYASLIKETIKRVASKDL